ncbi:integrin alpha-M-like [Betta splendens]|uniref:Integrin alpha-M-like n=1 Tax=Betta splendens TaxID=158456 RepID=A0A6P7L5Z4_BETSP|nr:integrin alpha-M-like [Betta splendens]
MDWLLTAIVYLSAVNAMLCFNIEPSAWRTLAENASGFGYQVVQRRSDLLVSAPLHQYSQNKRGQIFRCTTASCQPIGQIGAVPEYAVNMSLGLTMTMDPSTEETLACGPTIPLDCKTITMYSGACFQIDRMNHFGSPFPSAAKECRNEADIAFLLDGSGSIDAEDFTKMKVFVKNLVGAILTKDTQFAVAQFSSDTVIHSYFDNFLSGSWRYNVDSIMQLNAGTSTAAAISTVVQSIFTQTKGSRPNVKKILIVITDGQSQDRYNLPRAINEANAKGIVRFAIGVGGAFYSYDAKSELDTIASSPSSEHVFQVESFDALDKIRQSLQSKIFSIEGTQSTGDTLKMEMAQEGFSAAYVPGGFKMGIVGANEWRGGFLEYKGTEQHLFELSTIESDSYIGYSLAVANTISKSPLTIIGAPRYKHRGVVITVYANSRSQDIEPPESQIQSGEYFGAELRAMDVNRDSVTDLILISAPMYKESDREGIVYVCTLTVLNVICDFDSPVILRGAASAKGRFGSSLAVLPDLNTDGLNDLAVGSPLEDDGQGSIYIFQGEAGTRIDPTFSQRIPASEVQSGLKFFGLLISQSTFDRSGDRLPDLAVGSKGRVVLLRSRPIVLVKGSVSYEPNQIPTQNVDCSAPLKSHATLCFTMTSITGAQAQAMINYIFTLDATRKVPNNRAYIAKKQQETSELITISNGEKCINQSFFIEPCQEDVLNELRNELRFTFDGLPSADQLRPSLHQQAQTTSFHPLGFEVNCGTDRKCVDKLEVDFNFNGSTEVKVGIDELLDVAVSLENNGENSYNTRVILTYPPGLSYRKFTTLKGRIECNSLDSDGGILQGRTECTVDRPIFKNSSKSFFTVSYGIDTSRQLDRRISITANATSGNQEHSSSSEPYKLREIDVKYSVFLTFESSISYSNFTFGKNDLQKLFEQFITVTNHIRALNFTVVIRVPVALGDKDIWVDSNNFQIEGCLKYKEQPPDVQDFVPQIQKNKAVDCSVARCSVFRCTQLMGRQTVKEYKISANLSSRWIEQIGLPSAKFLLTSTASLEYDTQEYIFFSTGSNNNPPVRKIEAEVEVYPQPNFTKEIVGGSLGGLTFLALLTAGLYKAGFFESKYKNMINEAEQKADPGAGEELKA